MKKLFNLSFFILGLIVTIYACKPKQGFDIANKTLKTSPNTYPFFNADSLNAAKMHWRQFFTDSILVSLIDSALKNNTDILLALQNIEKTKADIKYTKGALFPYVNLSTSTSLKRFGDYTMDGAGNRSTYIDGNQIVPSNLPDYNLSLQSTWEIDLWKKLRNKKKNAVSSFLSSVESKNLVYSNLIYEIATSYYELLSLDYELHIVKENIKISEAALKIITTQKDAGRSNELAIKQFEAQLLKSKAISYEIQQKIILFENKINLLLTRYPQKIARDSSLFLSKSTIDIHTGNPSDLLKNRPDIRKAELELEMSKVDVNIAKAAFYPSLTITSAAGVDAYKTKFLFTTPESFTYSILAGLTAPVVNRSALKASFKKANARQIESMYEYQRTIIKAYIDVVNEILRLKNLKNMYELKEKEVEALTTSNSISVDLFKTGRATYLEILYIQQNILTSKIELVEIKKQELVTGAGIYKALGGGWQ